MCVSMTLNKYIDFNIPMCVPNIDVLLKKNNKNLFNFFHIAPLFYFFYYYPQITS